MEDTQERWHYEIAALLHSKSKAQMLIDMPASELPFWEALINIHIEEENARFANANG
jgi:hypothetical protein